MGCCQSKGGGSAANQAARWRSTGIVALRDCRLKALPGEVLEIDKFVRTLDLTNNRIVEVPTEISKLNNMQRLVLAQNLLEHLPASLGNLHSLRVLTLDANRLRTLPDELGFLVRLEQLSVMGNLLTCLPETLGNLENLQLLNVSGNKLKSLPETIRSCSALEEVRANVMMNPRAIPMYYLNSASIELLDLEQLHSLPVDDNSIEELPSSICSLIHLKSLTLDDNHLHQLPPRLLKDCIALQNLALHGNPISMDQFQQMEGFQEFEARRKKKFDKQIDSNVMMGSRALDEGLDL